MKKNITPIWGAMAVALMFSSSVFCAAAPRLFPDLVMRYTVGDTNAENPLRSTEGPKALTTGDLNGDGLADVVTGSLDGSVSVLLSRGQHGMDEQILVPATGLLADCSIRAIVTADFDRDGKLDAAVGEVSGDSIVILLGDGTGNLQPSTRIALGPVRALSVADFNGDGKMDLLAASGPAECNYCTLSVTNYAAISNRFVCILPGNGDGTFQRPQYLLGPGAVAYFYDVAAADINQDGAMDVLALDFSYWRLTNNVVTNHHHILILTNDGLGTFTHNAPQQVLQVVGRGARSFCVAYLDERNVGGTNLPSGATLDIVVANRDSATLEVFLNYGELNFASPIIMSSGDSPRHVAAGDLDGDGFTDLVVVDRDEDVVTVMRGVGGGRFANPTLEYPAGVSPRQIVLADFSGDGALDAAVNNRESGDISIFIGKHGLAGFLLPSAYYPAGITPVSVVAEDFNGDGAADLATVNLRSHDVRVRLNLGNGTFGPSTNYPVNYEPVFIAAGDINQDGRLDLVVTCLGAGNTTVPEMRGALVVLLGRGDGSFQTPITTPLGIAGFQPYWLRLGDLSGDGVWDAAVGGVNGALLGFKGKGDGSFEAGVYIGHRGDGRPLGLALADFNQDGQLDIATSRGRVFLNDGQFFSGTNWNGTMWLGWTKTFNSGTQAWAVEAEDLDDDGTMDLIVALTFRRPDPIGVLFGRGDGSFTEPTVYEGPDVGAVALAGRDMDGDGIKDIVVGNRCAATVIIMKGLGDRQFRLQEIIHTYSVEDVAIADLNRDGKPDLVGVGMGVWPILNGGIMELAEPQFSSLAGIPDHEGLYINEIMSLNQSFYAREGTTPDWVEIYNHSALTQNLAGWSLAQISADGDTNRWFFIRTNLVIISGDLRGFAPTMHSLGEISTGTNVLLPPWGYAVVFCRSRAGNIPDLYAPYELSSEGETLVLYGPGGWVADRVAFPALPVDVSYARFVDGGRYFAFNPAPSLGAANTRPANLQPSVLQKEPYVSPGGTTLGLTARVFDDVAVAYAAVCFRVAGQQGTDFTEIPLSDDGMHGDKLAGDGFYGALLPPLPPAALVEYYLRVVDLEGQVATSPDDITDTNKLLRAVAPRPGSPIRLNELVADNETGLQDERGQFEDWVELVNTGSNAVCLSGLALGKDPLNVQNAWLFPSNCWLNPGEYLVVFCDNDPLDGPYHTPFKLQRDADRIYLFQVGEPWTVIDALAFGPLAPDTSFGLLNNGLESQVLTWPTPGRPNVGLAVRPTLRHPGFAVSPRFAPMANIPGALGLRWFGNQECAHYVQWTEDFKTWHWANNSPLHLGEGLFQWTDLATNSHGRFYRVLEYR